MEFYLKINGLYSYTVDKQIKGIDDKDAEFMKFPSASLAAQHIQWIKQSGFDVKTFSIVPAGQPLQIEPGIKLHNIAGDAVFTTGAYIMPFSYTNREGKPRFCWMVTGFEADTFCDGEYFDVTESAGFLEGLTPPADDEERKTEYIIQSLQSFGFQCTAPGLYKTVLTEESSTVYIRQLDGISQAGHITQTEQLLDAFLLDSPCFSQTLREIIVDTFGRDRQDIYLTDDSELVIGSCRANIWLIKEQPHKYTK